MRLTAAFVAHELRVQRRSLRFRAFAAGYLVLACLPPLLIHLRGADLDYVIGGATYAAETLAPLPLLTAILAGLLSLDGIARERNGGAWTTATLAGISNAGYLMRRWLALLALILPLTALPLLAAAGLAAYDGCGGDPPAVFAGPWLLHVVPVALVVSALALGLGTIGANAVSTLLLYFLAVGLIPSLGSLVLDHFHLRFERPIGWVDLQPAMWGAQRITKAFSSKDPWRWAFPLPETEAGFDARTEGEQEAAAGLLLTSLAAAFLGIAVLYLRRTRPDVRPRPVRPDHPLRNFLASVGRLREQYAPDPRPAPTDLALLALALLAASGAVAVQVQRARHYEDLATRRFQAESRGGPRPTPAEIVPERWRIEGSFTAAGALDVRVRGTLRNTGRRPQGHLAFELNPELEIAELRTGAGTRSTRAWDRLSLDLDPPIPAGGRREIEWRLTGRPGEPRFALPSYSSAGLLSFSHAFDRHRRAAFSHDRSDLSWSYEVPAVSGLRVDLYAAALTPVPRYTPWTLDGEGFLPNEVFFPPAQLELSLVTPPGLFAADSCGGLVNGAEGQPRPGRLDSRCTLPLAELTVVGGRQRLLPGSGDAAVAVYPAHRELGELHLGFLAGSRRLLDEAWPGLGGLGRMVIVERPDPGVHDRRRSTLLAIRYYDPFASIVSVRGNLVFLQEVDLLTTRAMAPEPMLAEIVAARLAHRRRIDSEDSLFFRQLFRALALQRLGLGPHGGAVVGPLPPERLPAVFNAAVSARGGGYWTDRFPNLVAALEKRTGAEPLRAAIEELLSAGNRPGDPPARFQEFAAILARHSEGPVEPMIRDFFLAGLLPEPNLEGVEFQPAGTGWKVAGTVHNLGTGEADCRVVLTTDLGPVETAVHTATGETAPFVLSTPHRPQGVFLDPDQECHRLVRRTGTRDRVYYEGGRR